MLVRFGDLGWDFGRNLIALDELRREMDRVFYGGERPSEPAGAPVRSLSRVELHDEGEAFVLEAEVPGFEKDELSISIEEGVLTVRGEQRPAGPEIEASRKRARAPQRFARSFSLPARIDEEKVTATLRNGILELRLPKAGLAKARQIEVRAQ